jgi:hypothetical protein
MRSISKSKSSVDFLKYFFTYNPRDTATRRKKAKDALRKTRKARLLKLLLSSPHGTEDP